MDTISYSMTASLHRQNPWIWGRILKKACKKQGYTPTTEYCAGMLAQSVFYKDLDYIVALDMPGSVFVLIQIHGLLDYLEFTRLYLAPIVSMNALHVLAEQAEEHDTRTETPRRN